MPLERSQIRIRDAAVELFAEKGSSEVSVTELAKAAGIARGTVYNNVEDPQNLFEEVAAELAAEMYRRILVSYAEVDDPAVRLAHGIRFYIRRAHEEPAWGRFITRFAFSEGSLREMWTGPPMQDVLLGIARGRYDFPQVQVPSVLAMIGGTSVSAMLMVAEGHRSWRDAGSECAALVLRALGIDADEARAIACLELPPLLEVEVS